MRKKLEHSIDKVHRLNLRVHHHISIDLGALDALVSENLAHDIEICARVSNKVAAVWREQPSRIINLFDGQIVTDARM